jgi:hypothetical protein
VETCEEAGDISDTNTNQSLDSEDIAEKTHTQDHGTSFAYGSGFVGPPSLEKARTALDDIETILKPPRMSGNGYKDPGLDSVLQACLEMMKRFLWTFIDDRNTLGWVASSLDTIRKDGRGKTSGTYSARRLHKWTWAYVDDHDCLPNNLYGTWNHSILEDKDLAADIHLHLQGIRKYVRAMDIVQYLDDPEILTWLKHELGVVGHCFAWHVRVHLPSVVYLLHP